MNMETTSPSQSPFKKEIRILLDRCDYDPFLDVKFQPIKLELEPESIREESDLDEIEDVEEIILDETDDDDDDLEADPDDDDDDLEAEPEDDDDDLEAEPDDDESNSHSKNTIKIQCSICNIDFSRPSNLRRHMNQKHPSVPYTYQRRNQKQTLPIKCPQCPKVFNSRGNFRIHYRIHRPPGMQMYKCNICPMEFVHQSSYSKHMCKHSDKVFKCPNCDFTTKYRSSVFHHKKLCFEFKIQEKKEKTEKKVNAKFKCDQCGKSFNCMNGVISHKSQLDRCKSFKCEDCDKIFYTTHKLSVHKLEYHTPGANQFPCTFCEKSFRGKTHLASHIRNQHKTNWPCKRIGCDEILISKKALRKHLQTCTHAIKCETCESVFEVFEEFAKHLHPLECSDCDKTFTKKPQLDLHSAFHDPLNLFKCETCIVGFTMAGELTCHMKQKHRKDNIILDNFIVRCSEDGLYYFTCKVCSEEFEDPESSLLTRHSMDLHKSEIGPFICPNCGKGFQTKFRCFTHQNNVHGKVITEFKCEICVDEYFLTKHGLHIHNSKTHFDIPLIQAAAAQAQMQTEDEDRAYSSNDGIQDQGGVDEETAEGQLSKTYSSLDKYSCLICGKKSSCKQSLGRHMTTHDMNRKYKCALCVMSFAGVDAINRHNKLRHAEMNLEVIEEIFQCTLCERSFNKAPSFEVHMRFHTREKPFKCSFCNAGFTSKEGRNMHVKIHTGEKEWSCDFCDQTFARAQQVRQHMKRHHVLDS